MKYMNPVAASGERGERCATPRQTPLDPAGQNAMVGRFRTGNCQCRLCYVNAQDRQPQRGDVKSVLAGSAARIEHCSGESAFGCQAHDC